MSTLRNRRQEAKITFARLLLIAIFFVTLYIILAFRLYHLQVTAYENYSKLSKHNNSHTLHLMPYRSEIVDRHGQVLANHKAVLYALKTGELSDNDMHILDNLGLTLPDALNPISAVDYAYLTNQPLDSIQTVYGFARNYPFGASIAHLIGHVGKSSHNYKLPDKYSQAYTGKSGIEHTYNHYLQGRLGTQKNILNAKGEVYREIAITPANSHPPLMLTIDAGLQSFTYGLMSGLTGSVIVINPQSGEILAAVSTPSYDNNDFDKSISRLSQDNDSPVFNRYLQALYPPASLVKPFVALGALEDGALDPHNKIHDPGYYKINDNSREYRNYRRSGHGDVDLKKALTVSNDTYFYTLSHKLGIDKIADYLKDFGFGEKTQLKLKGESSGTIPDAQYRSKHYKKWYAGQTIITGIGQGDVLSTPLQLARATMLLANDGIDYPLHIVPEYIMPSPKKLNFSQENRKHIIDALQEVSITGTARKIGKKPFSLACKTGSAQVAELKEQSLYAHFPRHKRDHHLFFGFAPVDAPSVAIVVVIEHQHEAVTIANSILDWCYSQGMIA